MHVTPSGRRPTRALVALGTILLLGCGPSAGTGDDATLDGDWILSEGTGPEGDIELDVDGDERAVVTLRIEGRELGGTAACNSYDATVDVDGDTVTISGLGATEMGCEPVELMTTEANYLAALQSVDTAEVTTADDAADALTLTGEDAVLRFTREDEGDDASVDG